MKLVEIYKSLIEAKSVGVIYHYTSIPGLIGILYSNKIVPKSVPYVSFTRDKNFHKIGRQGIGGMWCRITIDGTKLSNKYQIKPYSYHHLDSGEMPNDSKDEMEERVVMPIKPILPYIIDIDWFFDKETFDEKINRESGLDSKISRYFEPTYENFINFVKKFGYR